MAPAATLGISGIAQGVTQAPLAPSASHGHALPGSALGRMKSRPCAALSWAKAVEISSKLANQNFVQGNFIEGISLQGKFLQWRFLQGNSPQGSILQKKSLDLQTPVPTRTALARAAAAAGEPGGGKKVLVVGATGGVGQLVVASLLEKGIAVRAVARDATKASSVLVGGDRGQLEVASADLRFPEQLGCVGLFDGVGWVVLATGTTAFPSKRWQDNNGPEQTDYISVKNFLAASPKSIERIVFISSIGVTRYDQLPFNILNLFGVLKFKRLAEELVQNSGIPYTILRPGRLTDGPYTSYDLNTLLRATSGQRKSVIINRGDSLSVETSRLAVAEAAVQSLFSDATKNQVFEIGSTDGPWPGSDLGSWDMLFTKAPVV